MAACKKSFKESRKVCDEYRDDGYSACDQYEDRGYNSCSDYEDRGKKSCSDWDKNCCTWWPCSWGCKLISWICAAWVWVSNWVCVAWVWISSWVCTAWIWISSWVCVAWKWIVVTVVNIACIIACFFRKLFNSNNVSHSESECVYGWRVCYRIDKEDEDCVLKITLKIKLDPADDVTQAEVDARKAIWEPAIERAWSNQHPIQLVDGDCDCKSYTVQVDVQFVESGEHQTVRIARGPGRENMTNWFHDTTGGTAAHEAGHMFGNPDEYPDPECPDRVLSTDGSIMRDDVSGTVKPRHYHEFADWISDETCCDYEVGD